MSFLELRQEPGVNSRIMAGMAIKLEFVQRSQDSCFFRMDTSGI